MKVFTWILLFMYQVGLVHLGTDGHVQVYFNIRQRGSHYTNEVGCIFPKTLQIVIKDGNNSINLHLHINNEIDTHVPLYISDVTSDGKYYVKVYRPSRAYNSFAAYQDIGYGAAMLVQCAGSEGLAPSFVLEGTLYLDGKKYMLKKVHVGFRGRRDVTYTNDDKHHTYSLTLAPEEVIGQIKDIHRTRRETSTSDARAPPRNARTPRAAISDYYVDCVVVVDFAIYRGWVTQSNNIPDNALANIRRYFAHVINGVNLRYKTMEDVDFRINIRLIGYVIAQTGVASPWTEKTKTFRNGREHVNADDVLESLKTWVTTVPNMPRHDHVILFTGYDLFGEDSGFSSNYTTGLAFIGTMCQGEGRSVSVVEDHGGFQSVGTAAHELGHSLGAEHDGLNNTCTPADRYIMAGASYNETSANKYNPWRFSPCSINYFKVYIDGVINNVKESTCFRSKLTPVGVPNITGEMAGQLLGPDEQCRHIYGPTSYLCRGENFGDATDICRAMFCRNPKTANKCVLHSAARGTSCGNKRWCVEGRCVGHVKAPHRPAGCPFGDQTGVVSGGKTCKQIVAEASGYCYVKDFRTRCCSSCAGINSKVSGCEYGDRVLDCQPDYCGRKFKDGTLYNTDCCGTCNYAPPTTTPHPSLTSTPEVRCRDQPEIESITCPDYVASAGKYKCYRTDVYNACCRTCENVKTVSAPSCPWGDRDPGQCQQLAANIISMCPREMSSSCCQTCDVIFKRTNPTSSFMETSTSAPRGPTGGSSELCSLSILCALPNLLLFVLIAFSRFVRHL
ncbi:A disintegrin and metalloproteinase with thrombospondin motifs 6-like [Haliotis cracherodii]|uniref:A disintegrin and metalloproteinase with thrombospondin motifs 6-like n=1 Tax=Haliotis cracherodii TaxID=6455 RepID=UPI0039ECB23C